MTLIRKLALVMLLALWVPATSHCLLVAVSGLESLACCDHAEEQAAPEHEDECETDSCSVVESGLYKAESQIVTAPVPERLIVLFELPEPPTPVSSLRALALQSSLPWDLLPRIPFETRAALPARAPGPLA